MFIRDFDMDFLDKVRDLVKRATSASQQALTEEATKTAVVMPFIQTLGFDVFSLDEVVPEFVADVGTKKGEKVDYAIKINSEVKILIEVKPIGSRLGTAQFSQLYRYFAVSNARLAILTNGREFWFFSDIEEANKMDKKPFFMFDLLSHDAEQVGHLAAFQKAEFDMERILEAASSLRYVKQVSAYLSSQLEVPDDDFVKFIGRAVHSGHITKAVIEQLRPAIQSALDSVIRDRIQDRLDIRLTAETRRTTHVEEDTEKLASEVSDIETTPEELQAFYIIRAIAAKVAPIDRVAMRDAKSYCAILFDDNNRKPICRLYFNNSNLSVGVFSPSKEETRHAIPRVEDIFSLSDQIITTVKHLAETS